jgi:TonB family protein
MKKLTAIWVGVVIGLLSFVIVRAQELPKEIHGGVLNGKATYMPAPEFPAEAKVAGVEATVLVDVMIDGSGTIVSATAQPEVLKNRSANELGETQDSTFDPLLRQAAEKIAWEAKFSPTMLAGVPVKVSGTLVYDFSASSKPPIVANGWSSLNGRATSLPKPAYPPAAKAVRAGGTVLVRVVIDESGNVIAANAISGHPLLRVASVEAAKAAKFSPTMVDGPPLKVSGILTYNFIPPTKETTN